MFENTTCYACGGRATSREHVPPKSFFPERHRKNLWTVPSCNAHNLDQNLDVEYVRSTLAMDFTTNELARGLVAGKVRRSWLNSPGLLKRTFRRLQPVLFGGRQTGVIEVDMPRFDRILSLIASALYFRDTNTVWPHGWVVYSATMIDEELGHSPVDPNPALRRTLRTIRFEEEQVPEPRVFRCGRFRDVKGQVMYRLRFYEGALVYVVPLPADGQLPLPPNPTI